MPRPLECIVCSLPIKHRRERQERSMHVEWVHLDNLARVLTQAVLLGLQPSHQPRPLPEV